MTKPQANKQSLTLRCVGCGHKWESRKPNPKCCPRCKRYDWKEVLQDSCRISARGKVARVQSAD